MNSDNSHFNDLVRLILPSEIFDYFEITRLNIQAKAVHVYLDEKNEAPDSYKQEELLSKGFHTSSTIQDFPIRDKALFLHVRRRRWLVKSTGQIIERNWSSVAKGTSLTTGFATFLKGVFG